MPVWSQSAQECVDGEPARGNARLSRAVWDQQDHMQDIEVGYAAMAADPAPKLRLACDHCRGFAPVWRLAHPSTLRIASQARTHSMGYGCLVTLCGGRAAATRHGEPGVAAPDAAGGVAVYGAAIMFGGPRLSFRGICRWKVSRAKPPAATYIRPARLRSMGKRPDAGWAASMPGMSERARASTSALQRALQSNPDTVMAYVTGSQARGTATAQSDLDIYHVVSGDRWQWRHYGIVRDAVGDRMGVDVIVDSVETAVRNVNLYGIFGYWAVREGVLVHENQKNADWRRMRDSIRDVVHLPDCAQLWLDIAGQHMDAGDAYVRDGRPYNSSPCMSYAISVGASLRAALTHDNIRFGFTKRLADMADMLRDRSVTCGHDLSAADDRWGLYARKSGRVKLTAEDARNAGRMAKSIYHAAREYVGHVRRSV